MGRRRRAASCGRFGSWVAARQPGAFAKRPGEMRKGTHESRRSKKKAANGWLSFTFLDTAAVKPSMPCHMYSFSIHFYGPIPGFFLRLPFCSYSTCTVRCTECDICHTPVHSTDVWQYVSRAYSAYTCNRCNTCFQTCTPGHVPGCSSCSAGPVLWDPRVIPRPPDNTGSQIRLLRTTKKVVPRRDTSVSRRIQQSR